MFQLLIVATLLICARAQDAPDAPSLLAPAPQTCEGQNEIYLAQGVAPNCDTVCSEIGQPCTKVYFQAPSGCYCLPNHARNASNVCVPISECQIFCASWEKAGNSLISIMSGISKSKRPRLPIPFPPAEPGPILPPTLPEPSDPLPSDPSPSDPSPSDPSPPSAEPSLPSSIPRLLPPRLPPHLPPRFPLPLPHPHPSPLPLPHPHPSPLPLPLPPYGDSGNSGGSISAISAISSISSGPGLDSQQSFQLVSPQTIWPGLLPQRAPCSYPYYLPVDTPIATEY